MNSTRLRLRFLKERERVLADAPSSGVGLGATNNLTICAIPGVLCPTDFSSFSTAFGTYLSTLSSASGWTSSAGASSATINLNTSVTPVQTTDQTPATVATSLSVTNVTSTLAGDVTFCLNSTSPVFLYYKITASSSLDNCTSIQACTDKSKCGTVGVTVNTTCYSTSQNEVALEASTQYYIEGCTSNAVFGARATTDSATITSFKTESNTVNNTTTSGFFSKSSMLTLIVVAFLTLI